MLCLVIGSLGVGQATSVSTLMAWRMFQAFAASGGMSIGSSVVGDIYKLEERGTLIFLNKSVASADICLLGSAMGVFFSVGSLLISQLPI